MQSCIKQYFPGLQPEQYARLEQLGELYRHWNAQINVISRTDIENLEVRHVLHSLAIAKVMAFRDGAKIVDLGTGGGFPGIPLAILYPEVQFTLIDSIGKKIKVVNEVASAIGLTNVQGIHTRAEDLRNAGTFDFVVTRAVAPLDRLQSWTRHLIAKKHQHAFPNGVLALKGGDLSAEIAALPGRGKSYTDIFPIREFFSEPFFDEKWVVYMQM
jgi:16S rRNA (guanine527-N7)-methyltransferase